MLPSSPIIGATPGGHSKSIRSNGLRRKERTRVPSAGRFVPCFRCADRHLAPLLWRSFHFADQPSCYPQKSALPSLFYPLPTSTRAYRTKKSRSRSADFVSVQKRIPMQPKADSVPPTRRYRCDSVRARRRAIKIRAPMYRSTGKIRERNGPSPSRKSMTRLS